MPSHPSSSTLSIDTFLPHMRDVARCEGSLHELNLMWRMIESSARMNCPDEAGTILPTMAATRAGFTRLEQELVRSLVGEKVANVMNAIGTQAQYVIDIVVRNLYERTADVGFLATDRELCAFVAGENKDVDAVRERLNSYRAKYTVYDEIMLIDLNGNVLVQIDPAAPVEGSVDPLIAQTLASTDFVETFRTTDLRPGLGEALVYSRRMHHPETGAVIGLLCLFFGFEAEMAGIFASHRDPKHRANMLLLDGEGRVVASADHHWIPRGAKVPVNPDGRPEPMLYAGREYLVCTCSTAGYQGYMGPTGWQGQVMIPVDLAFSGNGHGALDELDPAMAEGLLSHAQHFSPPLHEVIVATETIRRVVWNGQVITAGQRAGLHKLKTILDQISETGARSNAVFSESIRDLYETVLSSNLQQTVFIAQLLVDLLDRNLYERADDCRWWAMTPELRAVLSTPAPSDTDCQKIGDILRYIHSLYTVYTRLFVYDREGRIVAQSDVHGDNSVLGSSIDSATLQQVLQLPSEQDYHVPPFGAGPLTGGEAAYTYHAAIRHPADERQVVGGIGIVFDARRELAAMLESGLGHGSDNTAFFIDREGRIIASTDSSRPIGSRLDLKRDFHAIPNGGSRTCIDVHDGQYAALGCAASKGYREFKTKDGYRDEVLAIVVSPLGQERSRRGRTRQVPLDLSSGTPVSGGIEYATFCVGEHLYALLAQDVQEALPLGAMTSAPRMGHPSRIGMLGQGRTQDGGSFVWVFDLGLMLEQQAIEPGSNNQIILLRHEGQTIGLLVSELHAVPELSPDDVVASPVGQDGQRGVVHQLIKARSGKLLIPVLHTASLFAALHTGSAPMGIDMEDLVEV